MRARASSTMWVIAGVAAGPLLITAGVLEPDFVWVVALVALLVAGACRWLIRRFSDELSAPLIDLVEQTSQLEAETPRVQLSRSGIAEVDSLAEWIEMRIA